MCSIGTCISMLNCCICSNIHMPVYVATNFIYVLFCTLIEFFTSFQIKQIQENNCFLHIYIFYVYSEILLGSKIVDT